MITDPHRPAFQALLAGARPILALAPMQDVTTFQYWRLLPAYGGADVYFTEYFRVHAVSKLSRRVLRCVTENPTGRPVVAQIIGNDIPALVRTARELQRLPVAAVDFNLGCPAPVVYRKNAGGGLLRDPARIDTILGALRDAIQIKFTVKTRIGFDTPAAFDDLLAVYARHSLDLLTVHGRLVPQLNSGPVAYGLIARAVAAMPCPVLANGDVHSVASAADILRQTRAAGLMIGRGAIRNPWIFDQIRRHLRGEPVVYPTGRQVLQYIQTLYDAIHTPGMRESMQVQVMKKYLGFIGDGIGPDGAFLHRARRVQTAAELFALCAACLDHDRPEHLNPAVQHRGTEAQRFEEKGLTTVPGIDAGSPKE